MPIEFMLDKVIFRDVASVDEAEALLEWLQKTSNATVDLAACTHLHTANLQVLMAARPVISNWPEDNEFRGWLEAALEPAIGEILDVNDNSRSR
jgi:hypothetical protein